MSFPSFDLGQHAPHQATANYYAANDRVVLYIFSPRQFGLQAKRPLLYNFTEDFTEAARRAVQQSLQVGNSAVITQVMAHPDARGIVVPSLDYTTLDLRHMSGCYTGMLIVNNERPRNNPHLGGVVPLSTNRTVYYGYFIDEPCNPVAHGAAPTVNPHATFVVTHKTLLQSFNAYGPSGYARPRIDVTGDADVVLPQPIAAMTGEPLWLQTPSDLVGNTVPAPPGGHSLDILGEQNQLIAHSPAQPVNAIWQVPTSNLEHVVKAVAQAHDSFASAAVQGPLHPGTGLLDTLGSAETMHSVIASTLRGFNPFRAVNGLNETQAYTLAEIDAIYNGELKVQPVVQPVAALYAPADQCVRSAANVFCSLLCQIVPPMLSCSGLGAVAFQYDSYVDAQTGKGFLFEHHETMMPMPPEMEQAKLLALAASLKQDIFPMMVGHRGHFRMIGTFSQSSASTCSIAWYDDAVHMDAPFEVPTVLGGLNTMLIGNMNTTQTNCQQLAQFIGELTTDEMRDVAPTGGARYDHSLHFNLPPAAPATGMGTPAAPSFYIPPGTGL